jgi:hypothetical protein
MIQFGSLLVSVALVLTGANLGAQERQTHWIQHLLPPDAKVIETAHLNAGRGKTRTLVLWMLRPQTVNRPRDPSCSDLMYGDHWYGRTRLSLVDSATRTLVNTIEIQGLYEGDDQNEHAFPIPFRVGKDFYNVPAIDKNKKGIPKLLNLRDLTGEGIVGQFVLFEYYTCGSSLGTVVGYSPKADAVVQFRVEASEQGEKAEVVSWVPNVFNEKPVRPGLWDFTFEPGHGADCWVHEHVSFDPTRQLFVEQRKVTPYPNLPALKKKD